MPNNARIVHNFVSTKPTRSDPTRIYGAQWNEDHVITGIDQVDNTSDATKNAATATLTNKTVDLASNTLTGTTAQFNTALTDNDFATLAGTETLTNKTINGANNTITARLGNDISGFGTGIATALAVNVGTDGAPVIKGGVLGTPSSGTATNLTGLPLLTGISGAGTGALAGLAVNVGTAGSVVINGGALGTPSSGSATNLTGLPVSTGISGLATGIASFLATPSSANLRAALTDEVGTGAAYFVGGALGTPASVTLTNGTGLPVSGISAQAAYTIIANASGSSAAPTAMDITSLTAKASPVSADIVLIQDSAASNAFKKTTVGALASAGSVASIAGNTGIFTLSYPLGNSTNDLRYVGPTNSGYLAFSSTTALTFTPYNGDAIKINGVVYQIPTGGISGLGSPTSVYLNGVAAQTLVANTLYYIYVFNNGGTLTADFSTTSHSASATAGNIGTEIKTGDDTRSLIGMVYTGATVVYLSSIATASWFNRRNKDAQSSFSSINATSATTTFVTWGTESVSAWLNGNTVNNSSAVNTNTLFVDGSGWGSGSSADTSTGSITRVPANPTRTATISEGKHTLGANFSQNAGTNNYSGELTFTIRG